MLFWLVFLKMHKKKLLTVKNAILALFSLFSKILIKITFLKLKQKKNMKKHFSYGFYFKLKNALLGGQQFFSSFNFSF